MTTKLRNSVLVLFTFGLFTSTALAQHEINVNPNKGLMTANIPLYTLEVPGFKLPLSLSYAARGYKVNELHRRSAGWTFKGSGSIRRILRGLPDEMNDTYYNRKGWMHSALSGVPLSFTPADDNDEDDCTDENANYNWLNNNYTSDKDLQPDVFVVDAPGLSCRLMMDNQGVFQVIPAQDLKIEFNVVTWNDIRFVITTNNGVRYTFDLRSVANKQVTPSSNSYDLFRDEANNYSNNAVYFDCWYLTKIEVLNSGKPSTFTYAYSDDDLQHGIEELKVYIKDNVADTARENKLYEWNRWSVSRRKLTSITSSIGTKAVFEGYHQIPDNIKIYYGLESGRPVDQDINIYDRMGYDSHNNSQNFLTNVSFYGPGCNSKEYKFSYYGFAEYGDFGPTTAFPVDPDSKQVDAWGYYNGNGTNHQAPKIYVYPDLRTTTGAYRPYEIPNYSGTYYVLPGNDLSPKEEKIAYGSLSKIIYPSGGTSSFEYECNSFLDEDANVEVKGGGIRIKAINHFDGQSTATIMRKEYIYKSDLGVTSGKINMLPAYAISTTSYKDLIGGATKSYSTILSSYGINSLNYWNYLTVRTKHDMYLGESIVSYTQVTTKESGNGTIKQVFSPGKSFWDTSTSVLSYTAETCPTSNSPFIIKGYNQYPFAPIEHSDGGDLLEESVYNEAGNLLKKREMEYEDYHTSPQRIYAVLRDNNLGLRQLSKYYIEIGGKLLKRTKETVYDSNLSGNSLVTQVDYDNSAFNRKIRSSLTTNSDNTQLKTSILYSGDFDDFHASDISNSLLNGIMGLKQVGNRDEILEQKTEINPGGAGVFKVVSAQAKLYNMHTVDGVAYPVLKETKTLRNLTGLTDFSAMQRTGSIPARILATDSRYETEQVFSDINNALLSGTITQKRSKTAIVSDSLLRLPMLSVSGADLSDIGFYNFDREDVNGMYFYGSLWSGYHFTDKYLGRYLRFVPSHDISKNLTRKPENKFYKFVFLARTDTATSVNFLVNGLVVSTLSIPVSDKFRFYEKLIDVSSISTTGFVKMTTNGNMYIDNVLLYPADAQFSMVNYDKIYGKTMEMNSSGTVKLYDYIDGRLGAERDLQGNITKANFYAKYRQNAAIPYYARITVVNPTKAFVGRTMQFAGAGSCLPGTKYIWNFGDGSVLESYDQNVTHVYTTANTYTVSLTLSHPEYTNHTSTEQLLIKAAPNVTSYICASGIIRINPCYDYIRYYNDCNPWNPGETDSPYGTKFTASGIGCTGTYAYKWEISYDGVEYYEVGPYAAGQMLELSMSEYYMDTWLRCRITAEDCDAVIYTEPVFIEANCNVY